VAADLAAGREGQARITRPIIIEPISTPRGRPGLQDGTVLAAVKAASRRFAMAFGQP